MRNRALASGFLTGNLINGNHEGTRLGDDNPLGKHFQKMYGSAEVMESMRKFDVEARAEGFPPLEVAIRWIFHHSRLTDDDAILLGASKTEQLVESVTLARKGPLPEKVVLLAESLWEGLADSRRDII